MKVDIEEIIQPIKKGAAVGFLAQLVTILLMVIYSVIITHSPFSIITRQGVLMAIEFSFILWALLYVGASMLESAFRTITGEEHPTVEVNNVMKAFIVGVVLIYILVLYKLATTVSLFTLAGIFLVAPVIIASLYTIDKYLSFVF